MATGESSAATPPDEPTSGFIGWDDRGSKHVEAATRDDIDGFTRSASDGTIQLGLVHDGFLSCVEWRLRATRERRDRLTKC
jgi:hypothetical protein